MESQTDYPMHQLAHQVIIITGASSGIGKAVALRLAHLNCKLILVARNVDKLKDVAAQAQKNGAKEVRFFSCDIRDHNQVNSIIESVMGDFSRIDVLVNAAGLALRGIVADYSNDDWNTVLDTNLTGTFNMCRAVLPQMRRQHQGQILNISSGAGRNGIAGLASYSASKFGVIGFTESLGLEVRNEDIRVSVICPGSTVSNFRHVANREKVPSTPKPSYSMFPSEVAGVIESMLIQPKQAWMSYVVLRPLNTSIQRAP